MVSAGSEITHGISKGNGDDPRTQPLLKKDLLYYWISAAFLISSHNWKRELEDCGQTTGIFTWLLLLHQLRTGSYTWDVLCFYCNALDFTQILFLLYCTLFLMQRTEIKIRHSIQSRVNRAALQSTQNRWDLTGEEGNTLSFMCASMATGVKSYFYWTQRMPGQGFLTRCFLKLCITFTSSGLLPSFWFLLPMPRQLLAVLWLFPWHSSSGPRNKSLRLYIKIFTSFFASEFPLIGSGLQQSSRRQKTSLWMADSGPRVRKILREEFDETLAKVTCEYLSGNLWKSNCPSGFPRIPDLD